MSMMHTGKTEEQSREEQNGKKINESRRQEEKKKKGCVLVPPLHGHSLSISEPAVFSFCHLSMCCPATLSQATGIY